MNLNGIIVDDEPLSRKFIRRFCERSGRVKVIGSFNHAAEAIGFLKRNQMQLIFLDVEMPEINGFQMLDQLAYRPSVIMTTGNTDYAFTAFEYRVTDFLKKPIRYPRFIEAVDRVCAVASNLQGEPEQRILIKTNGGYIPLRHDEILYMEGMGDYVKYVTPKKTYITHNTLTTAEREINNAAFLKVHRSYIVNLRKITAFADNNLDINGSAIPVSRANKAGLLEKLRFS